MVFSSVTFLTVFLPVVTGLYYFPSLFVRTSNSKYSVYKNIILCIASLLFYAWGEPRNIILMLLSICFNYTIALHMEKASSLKVRRLLLIFDVLFNAGLLVFFKYSSFLVDNISLITGSQFNYVNPALPIGISFYTFQILSYVIDVYRKDVEVQHNIIDFSLYISMFPQLIAGPIVQYTDIDKQLKNRNESLFSVSCGIILFIKGLAKKTVLANAAGAVYEQLTGHGFSNLSMLGAWTAIIFYAFQIYFDFGGYSDMARGLGGIFGFTFPVNFNHPYVADSITDFWRRWHITLSSWFRDYIYIPLGGNRCSKKRHILNLFVVWSLTGLWHGASWNFLFWGIYYFILLTVEKYLLNSVINRIPKIIRRIITFVLVLFGWVLFACTNIADIGLFFKALFGFNGFTDTSSMYILISNLIFLAIMSVCSTELFSVPEPKKNEHISFILLFILSVALFAVSLMCLIGDTYNPFLYFRF